MLNIYSGTVLINKEDRNVYKPGSRYPGEADEKLESVQNAAENCS